MGAWDIIDVCVGCDMDIQHLRTCQMTELQPSQSENYKVLGLAWGLRDTSQAMKFILWCTAASSFCGNDFGKLSWL